MKLKQIFIAFLSVIALYSCSEKEDIPADADDNFITKVTVSVAGETYSAVIASDTITVTVPYTVSLNGASATVEFTPSAKIMPDPATITDWDTERTFRVTSFNGQTRDYTYLVIKDEIRSKGNVELKTPVEIASFAATGTSIIEGDLVDRKSVV